MRPYTLDIEIHPASPRGGEYPPHEKRVIHATDDSSAIQQAKAVADDLASTRGTKVIVMVIGPSSGHPIATIERSTAG
jgi:hypothetical protein